MVVAATTIYDAYAPIYDAIGQHSFGERMAGWALGWLAERGARPARVLDLACGTGAAAIVFAAAGCAVVGVDQSAAMLGIARSRARDAGLDIQFVEGDIRDLVIEDERRTTNDEASYAADGGQFSSFVLRPSSFDLATCFYDSLNYLAGDGDLDRAFAGAAAALQPGGYLVCDLNMPAEYATWDERDVVVYDGPGCMVYSQLRYDPQLRQAVGRIVWFVRETELWWRGEETHIQRAWSDAEVCAALARAGLALVGRLSVEGGDLAAGAADVGRVVYVARKEQ